jgi:hypothetical protein
MRNKMQWAVLLGALGFATVALAAGVGGHPPATGGHFTSHTLPKPSDFTSLEDWASHNFTDYLLGHTIRRTNVGEFDAITFQSKSEAGTDFNLLFDSGESLVLVTTSRVSAGEGDPPGRAPATKASTCDTATNRCNCVLYARCKVPSLPFGLVTYANKVAIINSQSAATGSVAIMNIGPPYGHVAVVTSVTRDSRTGKVTSITVTEANYRSCQITTRSGSPESMKVTGYFRP